MINKFTQASEAPSLFKLGACFLYESLVVLALAFICTLPFLMLVGQATHGLKRYCLQLYLWLCIGAYFVWCWHKNGQTLAMQTWQIKLIGPEGDLISIRLAALRYLLATCSLLLLASGFLWAAVNKNHVFFHDKILKNRLIYAPRKKA